MSDLLDKHSEDYDPDALAAAGDLLRKQRKEHPEWFACGKPTGIGMPWFNAPCSLPRGHSGPHRSWVEHD